MTSRSPRVSVIVPARNAARTLPRTLDSLARQDLESDFEVIVVDNGSSDSTGQLAREHPIRPVVIENLGAPGPGDARNAGAAIAQAPVLAFTDADCFPSESWLSRGLEAIGSLDLVQGAVDPDPEVLRGPFDRTVIVTHEHGFYETANLLVRRDLFDRIGGFEDWIVAGGDGLFGWRVPSDGRPVRPAPRPIGEDVLFGWQARRLGARTGFAPDALVHHAVFAMTPLDAIRYRWVWRHLPGLAKSIPEMRERTFYRRWFFEHRTAVFDLAIAGVLSAAVLRKPHPLLLLLPYARTVGAEAVTWKDHGAARVAVTRVGIDGASCVALVIGSFGWRAVLL